MSEISTMKQYLVSLGFKTDIPSLNSFTSVLKDTSSLVEGSTVRIATNIAKWTGSIIGLFAAVSGAVITTLDKVAMADQEYRLFGERMFMDTAHAKSLKIALDALGQPLEAIAFDPELHRRFEQLSEDQKKLQAGLGGGFENSMLGLRDLRFEFTRFEVELEYLTQGVVSELFKQLGLGNGNILQVLRNVNDYIIAHIPEWSRIIAKDLVPILKDTWVILKDVGGLFADIGLHFTNLVGLLTGDDSIKSATFDFEKFAEAIGKCVHGLAWIVDHIVNLNRDIEGFLGIHSDKDTPASAGSGTQPIPTGNSASIATQARQLAGVVSGKTGVPQDIIYAQWAHETGNFTNRGSRDLNNYAGIRKPGSKEYQYFQTPQDFAAYYNDLLHSRRYRAALGAQTIDQFVRPLKSGGYMEAPLGAYENGMQRFMGKSGGTGHTDNSVVIGDIHIAQPHASADEISAAVVNKVKDMQHKKTQRQLAELTSVYG